MSKNLAFLLGGLLLVAGLMLRLVVRSGVEGESQYPRQGDSSATRSVPLSVKLEPQRIPANSDSVHDEIHEYGLASVIGLLPSEVWLRRGSQEELRRLTAGLLRLNRPLAGGDVIVAAGHRPFQYEPGMEMELVPVLGISLHSFGLRPRALSVRVAGHDVTGETVEGSALVAGFVGADSFALAVDGARYDPSTTGPMRLDLVLADGLVVTADVDHRATGVHWVEVPLTEVNPCEVLVEFGCEANCEFDKEVRSWSRVKAWGERPRPIRRSYPWGELIVSEGYEEQVSHAANQQVLGGLAAGKEYGVGVTCGEHNRYAREFFTARDGLVVSPDLGQGVTLGGNIEPGDVEEVDLDVCFYEQWSTVDGPSGGPSWHSRRTVPVVRGRFEARFPEEVPISDAMPSRIPRYMMVDLRVPACGTVRRIVDFGSTREADESFTLDCGADVLLSADGGPILEDLAYVMYVDQRGDQAVCRVSGVRRSSGGLAVEFDERRSVGWGKEDALPPCIVVVAMGEDGYEPLAFVRRGDTYWAAEHVVRSFRVSCDGYPAGGDDLWIGWRWKGIDGPCERVVPGSFGTEYIVEVATPVDVESFWWSTALWGGNPSGNERPIHGYVADGPQPLIRVP